MKRTVLQMLHNAVERYPNTAYTNQKGDNGWVGMKYPEVLEKSRQLASAFIDLGMKKGDKIALVAEGRNNWIISEFGMLFAGLTNVPMSIKLLPEELLFRINHSDSKAIVVSKNTLPKLAEIWKQISSRIQIIYMDDDLAAISDDCAKAGIDQQKDIILLNDLLTQGAKSIADHQETLKNIEDQTSEDDVVTICYTSGTTGDPKGIMLTHLNYWSNSSDAMEYFNVKQGDRLYIILPLDHSFAHTVGIYAGLLRGLSLYFVDARGGGVQTLKNIPINLVEANPHFMLTVPAITSNFMNKIKDGVEAKGAFVSGIFNMGMKAGARMFRDGYNKAPFPVRLVNAIPYFIARKLVFSKIRKIFGDSIRYLVGGGALLDIKQQVFFYSLGVKVYQGYGLTEATPIISANTSEMHKLGTSGKVIPNVECKIVLKDGSEAKTGEQGEIVIKGNNVMKGYYKNPEATENTIKNNWLFTGDLGYYDKDGFLIVVGREKALLISADGEKYSPEGIEEAIQNCSGLIHQIMIYNDMKKYTSGIITLNEVKIRALIKKGELTTAEDVIKEIQSEMLLFKETKEYKGQFPNYWIPSTFQIVSEHFTEQNHQLNSSIKMVRHKILEDYKDRIDYMYTPQGSNILNTLNVDTVKEIFDL